MDMESQNPSLKLSATVLESSDPRLLANFYRRLLGWHVEEDGPTWVTLRPNDDSPGLSFQLDEKFVRPTWPSADDSQRVMAHLDIKVESVSDAAQFAESLGATVADFQPQDEVRICLDPDGHPFCLFTD